MSDDDWHNSPENMKRRAQGLGPELALGPYTPCSLVCPIHGAFCTSGITCGADLPKEDHVVRVCLMKLTRWDRIKLIFGAQLSIALEFDKEPPKALPNMTLKVEVS
jgi:hypothetical protein